MDKHRILEGILVRIVATVIGTVLLILVLKWLSLPIVGGVAYKRITRSN